MHKVENCPSLKFTGAFTLYGTKYRRDTAFPWIFIELDEKEKPTGNRQTLQSIELNQRQLHGERLHAARIAKDRAQ